MSDRTFYATTYVVADGVTKTWPFSFAGVNPGQASGTTPYIEPEDVKVQELYTDAAGDKQAIQRTGVLNSPNQITIDGPAVIAGREIRIYRETELRFPLVDYRDLQSVSEHDLDLANRQAVFIAQETRDAASANILQDSLGNYDAKMRKIVNVADGTDAHDAINFQQFKRTVRVPDMDGILPLPPAAERVGKVISFDAAGQPTVMYPPNESALALEMRLRSSAGAGMTGWEDPYAVATAKKVKDMIVGMCVSVMRVIPEEEHEAIYNFTSTYDVTPHINALLQKGAQIYFPVGGFYFGSTLTPGRDGACIIGAGMGHSRDIVRLQSFTRIWTDKDIELFATTGTVYVTIRDMLLQVTVPHTKRHIRFTGGAKGTVESVRINGVNTTTEGSGILFDGGSMGVVDRCILDHASIDVNTWDVHITNSWIWANSKRYGIRSTGSIGNLLIAQCDVLPPRTDVPGAKAGIYLTGAALQPRIIGCYGDGNPSIDTAPFMLLENGVLAPQMAHCIVNSITDSGVILDSILGGSITGNTFYNGNKAGNNDQAADITVRQTFPAQPTEKTLITGNTHIQVRVRATPAPAILVKAGTKRSGLRITGNTILQPGTGGGYTEVEIKMEDGAFPSRVAGSLTGNAGQRSHYTASASKAFASSDVTITIPLGVTLAYLPRHDQIHVTLEGAPIPYRVQVVNTSTVLVGFAANHLASGTVHVAVTLD